MKISVVTPTFNSGLTVRDSLESVLRQTHKDIEHIIVDGGSSDDTVAIVQSYKPCYNGRLKVISEPDEGIYDAMNKGISMATGDVVGILNSDDFFTSDDILETVARTLEQDTSLEALYGNVHYVRDTDLKRCVRFYSSKGFRRWKMRMGFMPAHPSFYCRRYLYERYGQFDLSFEVASDFECLLRFIFVNHISTVYVDRDFVTMRTGGASSSGLKSHRQIWSDHRRAFEKNHVYSNFMFQSLRYIIKVFELMNSQR